MLVLSRRRDEAIIIHDNIEITVIDIRGDRVRLGIQAPASICVHRKELRDAIQRENQQAASLKQRILPKDLSGDFHPTDSGKLPPGTSQRRA